MTESSNKRQRANGGPKRPIDRIRDSAGSFRILDDTDPSATAKAVTIGGRLLIVKEASIHEFMFADQIDPDRTNINVPNAQRKIMARGAASEIVRRMLLSPGELLREGGFLVERIDREKALETVYEALREASAMADLLDEARSAESAARSAFSGKVQPDRSIQLPTIGSKVLGTHKDFVLHADRANLRLLEIFRLFFEDKLGNFEDATRLVEARFGPHDRFTKFLGAVSPFFAFVRESRNAIEHARATHRVVIRDFELTPEPAIAPPTIEVIHPKMGLTPIPLTKFYDEVLDAVSAHFETAIAYLCDRNTKSFGELKFGVSEVPADDRKATGYRFQYQPAGPAWERVGLQKKVKDE